MTPTEGPVRRNQLGARIRELRKNNGFTQVELARRAGMSLRAICYAEAGEVSPLPMARQAIAAALGVTVEDLEQAS